MNLTRLDDKNQAIANANRSAKANVFHAAKPKKAVLHDPEDVTKIARELSSGLAHQDARHDRITRKVPANPEFIRAEILVTDDQMAIRIAKHDRAKLLHFEALRVPLANTFKIYQGI